MEHEILIEDWSPVSEIQAFVEKSDKNYYFYFWINPESDDREMRACWICNRVKAPADIKEAFKVEGEAPCMPEEFVGHDINGMELDAESLSIEWFEEGDSAALLSGDKIIAVIPSFSGINGFYGYSVFAKGTGPFAWELTGAYQRFEKEVENGRKFWNFFDDEEYWGKVQDFHFKALESFFGDEEKYYAIDGDEFPPKAVAMGRRDNILYNISLGVSMIPMPTVEMTYQDDYKDYRRMELGFACDDKYAALMEPFVSSMSWLAAYPWKAITFLGHGHTIPFKNIKGKDYILFLNSRKLEEINAPKYDDFMGDKINLLWLVPITKEEQALIVEEGVDSYLKDKDISRVHIFE